MSTRDLFEMASLDVLGLLDEDERNEFERAFKAAPPEVQAQIRAEQVRFSRMDTVLPRVDPPAGLRARVLAAVRDAIDAVSAQPVARIGATRVGFNSAPLWRAACLGFATASVVLGGFSYWVTQQNRDITSAALSNRTADSIRTTMPEFTSLVARPRLQQVNFSPAAPDYSGKAFARLFVDLDTKIAYLVCDSLPITGEKYTLVITSPSGDEATSVADFPASAGRVYVPINGIDVENLPRLEIHSPKGAAGKSEPLLRAGEL